jgi:hypothetical protein
MINAMADIETNIRLARKVANIKEEVKGPETRREGSQ